MITGQGTGSSRTNERSATDHQEIEWQFDAGDIESVVGRLAQHDSGSSGLPISPESMLEITDTYHDSDVWRFYRASYALRVHNSYGDIEAPA